MASLNVGTEDNSRFDWLKENTDVTSSGSNVDLQITSGSAFVDENRFEVNKCFAKIY